MDAAQFKYCISNLAKGIHDGNLECIENVLDRIPVYHDMRKIGDAAENLVKRFHQLADKYNNLKLSYRSKVREFEKDRAETDRSTERLTGLKERLANEAVYSESLLHKNDILLERINELRKENERLQSHSYEYNRIVEKEIEARKRRESHLLEQVASLGQRLQEKPADDVSRRSSSRSSSSSDSSSPSSSSSSPSSKSKSSKDCKSKESKSEKKDKDRSGIPFDESINLDKKYTKSLKDEISQSSREVNESGESTKTDSEKTRKISKSTPRRTEKVSHGLENSEENVEKTRRSINVTPRSTTITPEKTPERTDATPRRTELISETKEKTSGSEGRKSRSGGKTPIDSGGTSRTNEVKTPEEDIVDSKVRELFGTEGNESATLERQVHQLKEDNVTLSKRLRQSKVEINNLNKKLTQLEQIKAGSHKGIERSPSEHADQMDVADGGRIHTKDRISPSEPGPSKDIFDHPDGKLRKDKKIDGDNVQVLKERLTGIEKENEELKNRLMQVDPEYVQDKKAMDHTGGKTSTTKERNQHKTEIAERHSERVQQLETENSQLKQRLVKMGDESTVIQDYDTKVYRLEEEKKALEGRLTEAENQVRRLDQTGTVSQSFERDNRSLFDRFRSNRQDNYDRGSWWTDRKIDRLERGQKNVEKKLRDAKDDVRDRDRTISKLENEIKSLRANDTELRKRMQQERQQLQKVKVELQQTEEQSKALRRSLSTTDRPIEPGVTGSKLLTKAKEEYRTVPLQDTGETKSSQLGEENRQLKERISELTKQLEIQQKAEQTNRMVEQDVLQDGELRKGSIQTKGKELNEDLVVHRQYDKTAAVNRFERGSGFDQCSDTEIQRLMKEIKDLRDRLNNALQESKALEESKVLLERERRDAEDRVRRFEEKQSEKRRDGSFNSHFDRGNGESNNRDSHLQRQLEEEQAEVHRLREELGHIQKEKEEMMNRNAELQNELEQQRNELQRVHADPLQTEDGVRLEKSVVGEVAETLEAEVPVVHQQQDVTGIPDSVSSNNQANVIKNLEAKVQTLENENKDLNDRLKALLVADAASTADKQGDVESSTLLFDEGKIDTTLGNGQFQTNAEDQQGEVQKYQSELQQLKSENEQFQNRINQLQKNLRDAEQDLRRGRSDLKNAEDRNSELQSSNNDLQRQLHQQQSETERLETELSQTHVSAMEEQGLQEQEEFMMEEKHEKTGGVKKKKKSKKDKEKGEGTEKSGDKDILAHLEKEPQTELIAGKEDILGTLPKDTAPIYSEKKEEDHTTEKMESTVLRLVRENKELLNSNQELKRLLETQRLANTDDLRKYPQPSDTELKNQQDTPKLTNTHDSRSVMTQTDDDNIYSPFGDTELKNRLETPKLSNTHDSRSVMTQTDDDNIYSPFGGQRDRPRSHDSDLVENHPEVDTADLGIGISPTKLENQSTEPATVTINRLETENRALQNINTEHEQLVGKLQAEVTQLKNDLQNLKDRENELLDRCNQLQKRIKNEQKIVEDAQSELRDEREKTSDLQKSNGDLQTQLEKCRKELQIVETELCQSREANEIEETHPNGVNRQLDHITDEVHDTSTSGLRRSFNSSREKAIDSVDEEIVHTERSGFDGDVNVDEKEFSDDKHDNRGSSPSDYRQIQEENKELQERLNKFIEESKGTEDLRIQIIYLQNEKKEAEERLRRIQRTNQIQNDPKFYERNGENVFTSNKRQQEEVERLNRELQKLHGENDDLRQSYIQLQSDSQTDRYELQRFRVEFQKLQKEKGELELRLNSHVDEESSDEKQGSSSELNERSNTGTSESEEINELRIQNIYLLNEKKELEERLKRLQTEKKKLQLRDSRMDYNILELEDLKKSNAQLKMLTEQQQREIQKLKTELRRT